MRSLDGNIISLKQLTYNGELDQRYIQNNNITGLIDNFVGDVEGSWYNIK